MNKVKGVVELDSDVLGKVGFHFGMWALIAFCKQEQISFDQFGTHLQSEDTITVMDRMTNLLVLSNQSYVNMFSKDTDVLTDFQVYALVDEKGADVFQDIITKGLEGMNKKSTTKKKVVESKLTT